MRGLLISSNIAPGLVYVSGYAQYITISALTLGQYAGLQSYVEADGEACSFTVTAAGGLDVPSGGAICDTIVSAGPSVLFNGRPLAGTGNVAVKSGGIAGASQLYGTSSGAYSAGDFPALIGGNAYNTDTYASRARRGSDGDQNMPRARALA